jgi:hypothetical protein
MTTAELKVRAYDKAHDLVKGKGCLLFLGITGSHLFGCSTEDSDYDFRGVWLPSDEFCRIHGPHNSLKYNSNTSGSNTKEDIDVDLWSLQDYILKYLFKGDTNAIELFFINDNNILYNEEIISGCPFTEYLKLGRRYLINTCNVKSIIGFAENQAQTYGLRVERLQAIHDVLGILNSLPPEAVSLLESDIDYIMSEVDSPFVRKVLNNNKPTLEVCNRKFHEDVLIHYLITEIKKVENRYGQRVREAQNGKDWKSISHSLRIIDEAIELISTKQIKFPLKDAKFHLQVKLGAVDKKTISKRYETQLARVDLLLEEHKGEQPNKKQGEQLIHNIYRYIS